MILLRTGVADCWRDPHFGAMAHDMEALVDEPLDPYSAQVTHAFDTVGPAVVHISARQADGRAGSGVVFAPHGFLICDARLGRRIGTNHGEIRYGGRFAPESFAARHPIRSWRRDDRYGDGRRSGARRRQRAAGGHGLSGQTKR
jgi:hypothetical protein